MFRVVRFLPSESGNATTTNAFSERVLFKEESISEEVRGGFFTEADARNYIKELYRVNPLTKWQYEVEPE